MLNSSSLSFKQGAIIGFAIITVIALLFISLVAFKNFSEISQKKSMYSHRMASMASQNLEALESSLSEIVDKQKYILTDQVELNSSMSEVNNKVFGMADNFIRSLEQLDIARTNVTNIHSNAIKLTSSIDQILTDLIAVAEQEDAGFDQQFVDQLVEKITEKKTIITTHVSEPLLANGKILEEFSTEVGTSTEILWGIAQMIGDNVKKITEIGNHSESTADLSEQSKIKASNARAEQAESLEMMEKFGVELDETARKSKTTILQFGPIALFFFVIFSIINQIMLTKKLKEATSRLSGSGINTSKSAEMISFISSDIANYVEKLNDQVNATDQFIKNVKTVTDENVDCATAAQEVSMKTQENAEEVELEMQNMVQAITDITASGSKIEEIVKTIDSIAFQTNILALNAAVEAARAGQAGSGFAVVADEVRTLAKSSSDAAQQTALIIEETQQKSARGVRICEQVNRRTNDILDKIKQMHEFSVGISRDSQQQSQGVIQVNDALIEIKAILNGFLQRSEDAANSSDQLNTEVGILNEQVTNLNQIIKGSKKHEKKINQL